MTSWFLRVGTFRLCAIAAVPLFAGLLTESPAAGQPGAPRGAWAKSTVKPSDRQIQTAIARGVDYLKSRVASIEDGHASLAAMAMIKAGVPADTPIIQAVIKKIEARVVDSKYTPANSHTHVYESAVSLMALANADPRRYKSQIQAIADYIISEQGKEGDWDYPSRTTGDTSISQYAILGLWEAARSGINVPISVWDKAARWHIAKQLDNGSFTYHPTGHEADGTQTMTVAGSGTLHVARMYLYPDARDLEDSNAPVRRKGRRKKYGLLDPAFTDEEEAPQRELEPERPTVRLAAIDKSISRGIAWVSQRYEIESPIWKKYYLYGIERLTALASLTTIDGHDWYADGSDFLLARQLADGSWDEPSAGNEGGTSFAILFLSKATNKMLQRRTRAPARFGAGLLAGGRGLPDNLSAVEFNQGLVQVRKLAGPVDDLLAELENAQSQKVESAQEALVETVLTEKPEELIGRKDRLLKLVRDRRPEVRRTALWALGRTGDLKTTPVLIEGLLDADIDCMIEARNALQFLSKKPKDPELPDEPTEAQRAAAVARWRKWYRSVRPYDERDDLPEATGS